MGSEGNGQINQQWRRGRVVVHGMPPWRIWLAAPFFKIGIWILGGKNISLEEFPPLNDPADIDESRRV